MPCSTVHPSAAATRASVTCTTSCGDGAMLLASFAAALTLAPVRGTRAGSRGGRTLLAYGVVVVVVFVINSRLRARWGVAECAEGAVKVVRTVCQQSNSEETGRAAARCEVRGLGAWGGGGCLEVRGFGVVCVEFGEGGAGTASLALLVWRWGVGGRGVRGVYRTWPPPRHPKERGARNVRGSPVPL